MKTVSSRLDIQVFVDCPHCESMIDLLDKEDTNGVAHNDCGEILNQACPDKGYWSDSHKKFDLKKVECGECKKEFNVKGMEW